MKKIITTLLSLALVIGMCPAMLANAETTTLSGTGVETDPYIIATVADLKLARDLINANANGEADAYYKVTANIDLEDEAWTPIAPVSAVPFTGVFDGDGHVISNVNIELNADNYSAYSARPVLAFFGFIYPASGDTASVKNLGLDGVKVINNLNYNDSISTWQGRPTAMAGFVGTVNRGVAIENCFVKNATLAQNGGNGNYVPVGGFCGTGGGNGGPTFTNCYVYNATISGVCNSSSYRDSLGGFTANSGYTKFVYNNCYTAQTFTTASSAKKTPFFAFAKQGNSTATTATNCYAEADDIATVTGVVNGGFKYWDYNGDATSAPLGTVGMTKAGLVETMTALGYVTNATINNGYPCLAWEIPEDTLTGSGTEADPYVIESASDLKAARDLINNDTAGTGAAAAYYEVTADIDLENEEWVPIAPFGGHSSHVNHAPFTGTFNGNGHVIKNINIPLSGTYNSTYLYTVGNVSTVGDATASPQTYSQGPAIGLFGFMNGTVTDLGIDGITVSNTSSWCNDSTNNWNHKFYAFGSIAGAADGTFERCYVKNANISYNGKSQASLNGIGGFIGIMSGGTYNDCYVNGLTAAVLNTQTVSISGFAATGTNGVELTNCYVANAAATFAEGNTATFYAFMQGGSTNYPSTPRKIVNCFSTASDSKETTISRGTVGQTAETISTTLLAVENTNWKSGTGINLNGVPALSWETAPVAAVVAPYVVKQVSTAKDTVTLEINKADTTGDKIYIATYDSEGRLIAADVQNVAATITTAVSAEGAATVKVFIWNGVTPVIDAVVKTSY